MDLAEMAGDDVTRLDGGPGGHVLRRGDQPDDVQLRPQPAQHFERPDHGGGTGHVVLHVLHPCAGLIEMPPVSNETPLPMSTTGGVSAPLYSSTMNRGSSALP